MTPDPHVSGSRRADIAQDGRVRSTSAVTVAVISVLAVGALLAWSAGALGADSAAFAVLVVWLPMVGLGTASHLLPPRLPARVHALRRWERDGRTYERLGVRAAKALLRRGPLAAFNPHLHLPTERTPQALSALEARMRTAEASHALLFVALLAVVAYDLVRGWQLAAAVTLVANVLLNGYPVMLQRYNRALLARRYPDGGPPSRGGPEG
jgi:hypothetical protein